MNYKLVDDESGKIICRAVIRSATEPGTANLRVDPIKPLSPDAIRNTKPDAVLDELMTLADFETPFSHHNVKVSMDYRKRELENPASEYKVGYDVPEAAKKECGITGGKKKPQTIKKYKLRQKKISLKKILKK